MFQQNLILRTLSEAQSQACLDGILTDERLNPTSPFYDSNSIGGHILHI